MVCCLAVHQGDFCAYGRKKCVGICHSQVVALVAYLVEGKGELGRPHGVFFLVSHVLSIL